MKPTSQPSSNLEIYEGGPYSANSFGVMVDKVETVIKEYCRNLEIYKTSDGDLNISISLHEGVHNFRSVVYDNLHRFFKSGLKKGVLEEMENPHDFTFDFCTPSNTSLQEIENGNILGALGIVVGTCLVPRYLKDGDAGKYSFNFEVIIRDSYQNGFAKYESYEYTTRLIKKSELMSSKRDESIQKARNIHKMNLMRILSAGAPGLGKR